MDKGRIKALVVVYALNTDDYSWLKTFYPVQRITKEASRLHIDVHVIFEKDIDVFFTSKLLKNICKKTSPLFLCRGPVQNKNLKKIEHAGFICINSSDATMLANDKYACYNFFLQNKILTPKTNTTLDFLKQNQTNTQIDLKENELHIGSVFPVILKPQFGSRGSLVFLINSQEELQKKLEQYPQTTFIVQQYIQESHAKDLRFFFIGDLILPPVMRIGAPTSIVSNTNKGGTMIVPHNADLLLDHWSPLITKIAKKTGLNYGSADFLLAKNNTDLYLCEVNASPGFEEIEKTTGINIVKTLLQFLFS